MLKAISDGNHVLNETIRLYKSTKTDCPDCGYDPVRKESTNFNCQTCGGEGSVIVETYIEIPASVESYEDLKFNFTRAGELTRGQVNCTIDMLELKTYLNLDNKFDLNDFNDIKLCIKQYDYIWWKGAKYSAESFEPGWLQGNLYEVALVLSILAGAINAN
jgi:hypothetical protein